MKCTLLYKEKSYCYPISKLNKMDTGKFSYFGPCTNRALGTVRTYLRSFLGGLCTAKFVSCSPPMVWYYIFNQGYPF